MYHYDVSLYQHYESYPIYTADTLPEMNFFYHDDRLLKSLKRDKNLYYNISSAFDIETSIFEYHFIKEKDIYVLDEKYINDSTAMFINTPFSFMYHWQFAVNGCVIVGRTWEEFQFFVKKLVADLELSLDKRVIIYVHNLSYEFQFIYRFFTWHKIMARKPHKVMKAITEDGIEFRCSYFLSNRSLKSFCDSSKLCVHGKLKGALDYSKVRYYDTDMTLEEFRYCTHDVLGLCECIDTLMLDDNLDQIPLTKTGFVRRDCRLQVLANKKNWELLKKSELTSEEYIMAKNAFRGGDTHANRMYAGKVVHDVFSYDITSSYPFVIMTETFPTGRGKEVIVDSNEKLYKYINDYYAIVTIELFDIQCKEDIAMPYIDIAHCKERHGIVEDNGRVYKADYVCLTCTSVDLNIIFEEYESKMTYHVRKMYIYEKTYLPYELRHSVYSYFEKKTIIDPDLDPYNYLKSKNDLNGIFGMMVTAIDQDDVIFLEETGEWGINKNQTLEECLNRYYNSRNSFLSYLWGVFITAFARRNLHKLLRLVKMDAVYVDTDCIKFIGDHNRKYFEDENKRIMNMIKTLDLPPCARNLKGELKVMGLWDYEGMYRDFKSLGAKKYCLTNVKDKYKEVLEDGTEVHYPYVITVSGMNKEKASKQIMNIYDDFKIGKVYHDVGRTVSFFNNNDIQLIEAEGRTFTITPNIGVVDTTYTMGISETYSKMVYDNLMLDEQEYIGVKYKKRGK